MSSATTTATPIRMKSAADVFFGEARVPVPGRRLNGAAKPMMDRSMKNTAAAKKRPKPASDKNGWLRLIDMNVVPVYQACAAVITMSTAMVM